MQVKYNNRTYSIRLMYTFDKGNIKAVYPKKKHIESNYSPLMVSEIIVLDHGQGNYYLIKVNKKSNWRLSYYEEGSPMQEEVDSIMEHMK